MVIKPDDPFRSEPRISRDRFAQVIRERAAAGVKSERDPVAYWDAIRATGIDPLLILAMFQHESEMGKEGMATKTHSWGNTHFPNFGASSIGQEEQWINGKLNALFPVFRDWLDGAISTAARLASPNYVYAERARIRDIFDWPADPEVVWAPAGDYNNPSAYLRAVIDFMNANADTGGAPPMAEFPSSADLLGYPVNVIRAADHGGARAVSAVKWFVVHKTEGNKAGDIPTLTLPTNPVASCHLWIGRDGEAIPMVPITLVAWCCANGDVDAVAINVELEGQEDEPTTEHQYRVMAAYFRWCEGQGMRVPREFVAYDNRPGIIGHKHVADPDDPGLWGGRNNHVDPGPLFDWQHFIAAINSTGGAVEPVPPAVDPNVFKSEHPDYGTHYVVNQQTDDGWVAMKDTWEAGGAIAGYGYALGGMVRHITKDGTPVYRQPFEDGIAEYYPTQQRGARGGLPQNWWWYASVARPIAKLWRDREKAA